MSVRHTIAALLVLWAVGAWLFPMGGMIHFLPIAALIVYVIDRAGRGPTI